MKKVTAFTLSALLLAFVSIAIAEDTAPEATDAMETVAQPVEVIETQAMGTADQAGDTVNAVEEAIVPADDVKADNAKAE